jgi:hypothetical protein
LVIGQFEIWVIENLRTSQLNNLANFGNFGDPSPTSPMMRGLRRVDELVTLEIGKRWKDFPDEKGD